MKVLITGSSGFVGQNLISYLSGSGIRLILISRQELTEVDAEAISNAGVVIHLAGKAHDLRNIAVQDEYYQVNFELTKKLYDAFLKSKATKFIFISSVKAAADTLKEPLTEDYLADPKTHYGRSKLNAEQYIQSRPLPEGKSYYILRPVMIHGPGNKGNLNLLYKFVSLGMPYPLAAFVNKRSFLSVENLCFVLDELIKQNHIESGIYNVADDEPISTSEVVSILSSASGKKAKTWKIPANFIVSVARLGDKFKLPLNTERLKKLTESYVVNNDKLIKALGQSLPVSTREGIARTARSFQIETPS